MSLRITLIGQVVDEIIRSV